MILKLNHDFASAFCLSMIFSDLAATPAEASNETASDWRGLAQAGNRYRLFRIMP
jgi:hypothetical protein